MELYFCEICNKLTTSPWRRKKRKMRRRRRKRMKKHRKNFSLWPQNELALSAYTVKRIDEQIDRDIYDLNLTFGPFSSKLVGLSLLNRVSCHY